MIRLLQLGNVVGIAAVIATTSARGADSLPARDLPALLTFGCEGVLARRPPAMPAPTERDAGGFKYRLYHLDGVTLRTMVREADGAERVADLLMPSRVLAHMGVIEPDDMRGFQRMFGHSTDFVSRPPELTYRYASNTRPSERIEVHFGRMELLHWIAWTCASQDGRMPDLAVEHAGQVGTARGPDLSPRQREDTRRAARPATRMACPSRDFNAFAKVFFDDGDVQRAFTALPLTYSYLDLADPNDEYERQVSAIRFEDINSMRRDGRFVIPWSEHARYGLKYGLSQKGRSATFRVWIPDTGFNINYTFRLDPDCWRLMDIRDGST